MKVKELIEREQKKYAPKNKGTHIEETIIGDHIALAIYDKDTSEELYFSDCDCVEYKFDLDFLSDLKVSSFDYTKNYGNLDGKLKLNIEV